MGLGMWLRVRFRGGGSGFLRSSGIDFKLVRGSVSILKSFFWCFAESR